MTSTPATAPRSIEYHQVGHGGISAPAVNVKDDTLWARDPRTVEAYGILSESIIEAIYQNVVTDFWEFCAPEIAERYGYGKVYSEGRSGGWLVTERRPFPGAPYFSEYVIEDGFTIPEADSDADEEFRQECLDAIADRDKWLRFADEITAAVQSMGDEFAERLAERVAEAEDNIVRGEN